MISSLLSVLCTSFIPLPPRLPKMDSLILGDRDNERASDQLFVRKPQKLVATATRRGLYLHDSYSQPRSYWLVTASSRLMCSQMIKLL